MRRCRQVDSHELVGGVVEQGRVTGHVNRQVLVGGVIQEGVRRRAARAADSFLSLLWSCEGLVATCPRWPVSGSPARSCRGPLARAHPPATGMAQLVPVHRFVLLSHQVMVRWPVSAVRP